MGNHIKGSVMDFYSASDLGIEPEDNNIEKEDECSELEWNYFYKFIVVHKGSVSPIYITGIVIANDEYSARAKLIKKYDNKHYENVEIRYLEKTDIIEFKTK